MLRKHVLSNYAEVTRLNSYELKNKKDTTSYETSTIESSDDDEFIGSTIITELIEVSDPDSLFRSEGTIETRNIETSDPDQFNMSEGTWLTFEEENSDPDEFYIS